MPAGRAPLPWTPPPGASTRQLLRKHLTAAGMQQEQSMFKWQSLHSKLVQGAGLRVKLLAAEKHAAAAQLRAHQRMELSCRRFAAAHGLIELLACLVL